MIANAKFKCVKCGTELERERIEHCGKLCKPEGGFFYCDDCGVMAGPAPTHCDEPCEMISSDEKGFWDKETSNETASQESAKQ